MKRYNQLPLDGGVLPPMERLRNITSHVPWNRRVWRFFFRRQARYERAVKHATELLQHELVEERQERLEAQVAARARIEDVIGRIDASFERCEQIAAEVRALHGTLKAHDTTFEEIRGNISHLGGETKGQLQRLAKLAAENIADHASLDRLVAQFGEDSLRTKNRMEVVAQESAACKSQIAKHAAGLPVFQSQKEEEAFDQFYLEFENRYRGKRDEIISRQKVYLPYLAKNEAFLSHSPQDIRVLDLGCGRGEWLELLKIEGYKAAGADLNSKMIEACRGFGLDVHETDAITFLKCQSDHSAAAITSFHLVEHLPFASLLRLLEEARRVLLPKGLLILETPNCNNVLTATQNFPTDPTHRLPIPARLLSFAAEHSGFVQTEILALHPYGPEFAVDPSTDVGQRFNDFFFGPQDYALIATNA